MNKFLKDDIGSCLKSTTESLFKLSDQRCWNKVSKKNVRYIITKIELNRNPCTNEYLKERRRTNDKKVPKTKLEIVKELDLIYQDLYDVNLFFYKCKKELTVIEVRYLLKSSFDPHYYKKVKDNPPMWHSKLAIPNYLRSKDEKFDANWELYGLGSTWKRFLNKLEYKLQLEK